MAAVSPFCAGASMPVWQDPFVEVLKFGMNHRSVGWLAQGDVEQAQDPQIRKSVFRIRGAIAASNYLRVPSDTAKGTQGLGLTGRFVYVQMRCVHELPVTIHLDLVTSKKTSLRFTLSSLFQSLRSAGTVLRVPLRLSNKWTVVAIDMAALLQLHTFNREQFHHLKSVTLCAAMNVRNVFASAVQYTPATLPPSLRFPAPASEDQYDWHALPAPSSQSRSPRKTRDTRAATTNQPEPSPDKSLNHRVDSEKLHSPSRRRSERSPVRAPALLSPLEKSSPSTREHNLHRDRTSVLARADQILRDAGIAQAKSHDIRQGEGSRAGIMDSSGSGAGSVRSPRATAAKKRAAATVTTTEWPDPILTLRHIVGFSDGFPSALMWLRGSSCCIYSSFSTIVVRDFQATRTPSSHSLSYPLRDATDDEQSVAATKGGSDDLSSLRATESFLWGHTAPVCGLALARDELLLASVEEGSSSVRLWDLRRLECVTALKAHARGVHALSFSPSGQQPLRLCAVGRDESRRVQIIVWDCSALQDASTRREAGGSWSSTLPVVARQTCDFPVTRIAFSPYEAEQLVSCGKENVRFWRLRSSHLAGSPVILNEYSRGTVFTDVAFDPVCQAFPSNLPRTRPLYVSSSLGTLLLINYDTRSVVCVYQLHDSAINCVSVNEGFCVTGSDDSFLRVWPLDFSDFFLEAQHEAGVASVEVSADGLRVLVGSRNGAIGVLDISNQRYDTVLRSHTSELTTMALTPNSLLSHGDDDDGDVVKRDEIVTTARDGTLRIWDAASGHQSYEFDVQKDEVTCLVVSPVERNTVAVGFASGCVRIFEIQNGGTTSVLREFQQHQSALRSVQYDRDGRFLYTSAAGQQLCMYDALERAYAPLKMLIADVFAASGQFCLSGDKKYVAMISADQSSVTLLSSGSLLPHSSLKPLTQRQKRDAAASPKDGLKHLLISGDALELLALSKADRLFIYSMETLQLTQTMQLLVPGAITALALSPNLKYLATGSSNGSLCVWRWAKEQRFDRKQQSFVGQAGAISRVSFTSDGACVVASGSASTLFIWEFHGEAGEAATWHSDTLGVDGSNDRLAEAAGSYTAGAAGHPLSRNEYRLDTVLGAGRALASEGRQLGFECSAERDACFDPEEMSPSLHVPVPSSKPNFSLSLAMDALVLRHADERESSEQVDDASTIEASALQLSTSAVVIEDLASGAHAVHHSSETDLRRGGERSDGARAEIALMRLSSSGERVAAVSTSLDAVVVLRILVDAERVPDVGDDDVSDESRSTRSVIALPPDTVAVEAMAFVVDSDDLLCFSCRARGSECSQLILASVSTGAFVWCRHDAAGDKDDNQEQTPRQRVREIFSVSDTTFVTLSGDRCRLESHELSRHGGSSSSAVASRTLLKAFPSPIQIAHASPADALAGFRRRYLLCVDNEAFCAVYDLAQEAVVATSQLMLHRSERRQPRASIDFLEWVETPESKSIVRGSKAGCSVFVHRFPLTSVRGSASIDWQLVARSGLPLLFHIDLDSVPRSLSIDPLRGVGVVATENGAVSLLVFKDGAPKRLLKQPRRAGEAQEQQQQQTSACWVLGDAILLTLDDRDSAIRCWVPKASREVAQFEVRGTKCTAMAVNDAFASPAVGSVLLVGYDDGSVRVFELSEMKLLAQCQLASRSHRPHARKAVSQAQAPGDSARIHRICFVGSCAAVVVFANHRVLLVDVSEVLRRESSCSSTEKPKKPGRQASREREIVCRELTLSQRAVGASRSNRRPQAQRSSATAAEPRVVDVDVKTRVETTFFAPHGSAASVFPFLLITRGGEEFGGEQSASVKVFGWSGMLVSNDAEVLTPTDEWRLGVESSALATFLPSDKPLVIYVSSTGDTVGSPDRQRSWCLEIRDYLQQRVLRRLEVCSSIRFVGPPSVMTRVSGGAAIATHDNQSVELCSLVLVADERGDSLLALELEQSCAIRVDCETAAALGLRPTRGSPFSRSGERLALSAPSAGDALFIGSVSFAQR